MRNTYLATKDSRQEQQRLDDAIKHLKKSTEDLGEQRNLTQKEANVATKAVKEAKMQAIQAEKEAQMAEKRL